MAPQPDSLSPAGSSTYQSNTMYVGDGTWDSTKNTFLLPNVMGLNFETMQYNGMGNRFSTMDEYHVLILGHGILAAIVFLFILPFSIMSARFRSVDGAVYHIYLNILALFLTTIVVILGWFAVGPSRSLTNPHHGIGLAIYVLMLVQFFFGAMVRRRLAKHIHRGGSIRAMLHRWLGRSIALLGIAQIPIGLTLYGSPKFTFVLYSLWMTVLIILYFILSHRLDRRIYLSQPGTTIHEGATVIEDRESGGIGRWLAPLAAGAGIAALLGRRRDKEERDRVEVIPSRRGSRRGSGSFVDEEKYSDEGGRRGGIMDKLLAGAAVLGAGALAKSYFDRRRRTREDEAYSAVAPDTPSRRHRARVDEPSVLSEDSVEVSRVERDRRHGAILPGPGDPLAAATAISAAQSRPSRPVTPGPSTRPPPRARRESYSSYTSTGSPSRREERGGHAVRNTVLGGIGLGWLAKKYKDRKDRQEQERVERIRAQEIQDERRAEADRRRGAVPPRYTGDGRRSQRIEEVYSDLSSDLSTSIVEPRRGTAMPPLAAALPAAAATGATIAQSRSRHDITEPIPMPPREPRAYGEGGSEAFVATNSRDRSRHSSRRGREAEAAAAGAAATLAAEEELSRREASRGSRSRQDGESPPVIVKVKPHGDRDRNITLRRLTEEEAAAARRSRRADSVSSLSASETAANKRRYRRDENARMAAAEDRAMAGGARTPLSPPRPAFAAGRAPKDSSYYSGTPPAAPPPESLGSPESHGSLLSPSATTAGGAGMSKEDADERRRRRRMERNQRQAGGRPGIDYT